MKFFLKSLLRTKTGSIILLLVLVLIITWAPNILICIGVISCIYFVFSKLNSVHKTKTLKE